MFWDKISPLYTLYDAGTVFNYPAIRGGDFVVGGIAVLTNVVVLINVLVRAKKNAEKFSDII